MGVEGMKGVASGDSIELGRAGALCGATLAALGAAFLIGGLAGSELLPPLSEAGGPAGVALAIALLLLGSALFLRSIGRDRAADVAASIVLAGAAAVLVVHVVPLEGALLGPLAARWPGLALAKLAVRISLSAAVSLSIFAASILLVRHGFLAGLIGSWATALIGGVAMVGYLLDVPEAAYLAGRGRISFVTGVALFLGGTGLALESLRRQRQRGGYGAKWVPYAAGAMLLLAGTVFWQMLLVHEEENLVEVTRVAAKEVATEFAVSARTLSSALSLVGAFQGDEAEADRWQSRARLLLTRFPTLLAIELYDAAGTPLGAVVRSGTPPIPPLAGVPPRIEGSWLSNAFRVGDEPAVRLVAPGPDGRLLAGVIGIPTFVEASLAREDRLHSIRLSQGETALYESGVPSTGIPIVRLPLRLAPSGAEWTLEVAGSPALARAVRSPLPNVALGLAAIIAALVVLSMRGADSEHRKALEVSDMNERLEVEIGERRRAETELRALNRELDERVRDRTGALAKAVDQLAAENRARQRVLAHLERMNASLRQFDGFISHELRQPLGALQIWVDLLESSGGDLSEKGRGYVAKSRSEIRRMSRMIENELRLSKATHGEAPTDPVALAPLLKGLLADLAPRLEAASARIELPAELPAVFVDPDQTRQVFGNLIENAVKYRRPESPLVIRIEAHRDGLPDGLCEVVVTDNGRGFEDEAAERLFDSFRRASQDQAGSGLGLAICRRIVEHHGGSIRAKGTPGAGASFYVRLPVAS